MDKDTRNRIERATQAARALLERDFADQLAGVFDIRPDGTLPTAPGSHLDAAQRVAWGKLMAAVEHHRASGQQASEAVATYLREAAFTTLNRFVALKMLEARGLVQECVSRGEQSAGFREFCGLAPGLVQLPDHGYRLYIESLFDELSTQIRVLFNRRDPAALLWLKRATLEQLLGILNAPELTGVWGEDETIGWVYQYYNDEAERKKMREESSAPRNSRELAVRNQFFTPRYVVEFLTDNTLGRLWYEMTEGQTRLKEQCRYLVRRLHEIFLAEGEAAPDGSSDGESSVVGHQSSAGDALAEDRRLETGDLTQEELLRQPVYIPHRPLKDPRDILLLDPACGSMHFGIYAFDLFGVIYEESWDIAQGLDETLKVANPFSSFVGFAASFPDKSAFLREVPRIIIEHNIHGIDIDPRALQIAALSLWLRAQRAWHEAGVKPADRPRIRRANLVCAEQMPGEKDMLREFVEQQFPIHERSAFHFLLDKVFDQMTLAGEAGSLLRIEEEIRSAITEARELAKEQSGPKQTSLFPEFQVPEQAKFDLTGLTDAQFWEESEQRIYDALRAYAEQAANGGGFRRRLFAEDAAQGFAFIDLCRKRYDVVVMNPPFGEASESLASYLGNEFPNWNKNILCAFIEREVSCLHERSFLASVMDRSLLNKSSYGKFRKSVLLIGEKLICVLDLGWEVLDANVEVAGCILSSSKRLAGQTTCIDLRDVTPGQKASTLPAQFDGADSTRIYSHKTKGFSAFPNHSIVYDLPESLLTAFLRHKSLKARGYLSFTGHQLQSDRHFRNFWEISQEEGLSSAGKFCHLYNGGEYSRFTLPPREVVWFGAYSKLSSEDFPSYSYRIQNKEKHFQRGVGFGVRGDYLDAHLLPDGLLFTVEGQVLPTHSYDKALFLVGLLSSAVASRLLNTYAGQHKYSGYVNLLPCPTGSGAEETQIARLVEDAIKKKRAAYSFDETCLLFRVPQIVVGDGGLTDAGRLTEDAFRAKSEALNEIVARIDFLVCSLYALRDDASLADITSYISRIPQEALLGADRGASDSISIRIISDVSSYALGAVFGRWDIRYAAGERPAPELSNPFDPLPVCPPGMLQGDDGLPLSPEEGKRQRAEGRYPLDIAWDGILVDDLKHPLDIERRVHDALALIWGDQADAIQQEACELLGMPTLREWFRRPAGFFADHLKRYSKSRRQAPIYWPLTSPGGRYTVWLYYHRFSKDTLYRALEQVQEKLNYEERKLSRLTPDAGGIQGATERAALADQRSFVTELLTFREEFTLVAPLWNPNLNDGVILNYGPLWRMIGHKPWQKDVKAKWDELIAGKYDWAHLAMHLWPERVVPKCATDRSLAIAHDMEDLFWVDDIGWRRRRPVAEERGLLIARFKHQGQEPLKDLRRGVAPEKVRSTLVAAAYSEAIDSFRQRNLAGNFWEALDRGDLDDFELARYSAPDRVVRHAMEDFDFAEKHGLAGYFWLVTADTPRRLYDPVQEQQREIRERTSAAVKDALKNLLEAPAPTMGRGGTRRSTTRKSVSLDRAISRSEAAKTATRISAREEPPDAAILEVVRRAIAESNDGASKSDVLSSTGLSDAQWNSVIAALLASGTVSRSGAGRGTRYRLNLTPDP